MISTTNTTLSISLFSGKGGVGKSSLCINLGYCLSDLGQRCLLLDCDLGLANLDVLLGVNTAGNLQDLLCTDRDAESIVLRLDVGLDLIPAASGVPELVNMDEDQRAVLLKKLQPLFSAYDFLILDLAAGLNPTVLSLAHAATKRILVLTPEPTSLTDAYAMVKVLSSQSGQRDFLVLINQTRNREEARKIFTRLNNAVNNFLGFNLVYLGMVREDSNMGAAILKQRPLVRLTPESIAASDLRNIAQRLQSLHETLLSDLASKPVLNFF
jgi:flagellar biosynthesis protein FlhG